MILAISTYSQATCLDVWEAEPDGLTEGCGIDMRNAVLVADTTIRKIETLTRYIAIGIGCIVGSQPFSTKL